MNQFKIVRLMIPSIKATYKERQAQEKFKDYIRKQIPKLTSSLHSSLNSQLSLLNSPPYTPVEPSIRTRSETTSEQDQCQDSTLQTSVFNASDHLLRKNMIDNRIKSLQYQANNPCEDTIVCEQLKFLDAYTVSIFDGHGGPELAEYSKCKINAFIDNYLKQHLPQLHQKDPINISQILKDSISYSYKQLEESFFEIYKEHLKIGNKKIRSVGACGITAIIHNDKVYIGNAGDSQAMFILSSGGSLMKTQKANERLSVNNKTERERIKQKWKDIDENIITQQGNNCYYLKGRLQPTRTIGDYYLKKEEYFYGEGTFKGPYLDCDPQVSVHQLTSAHKYMVMASDGVWDVLSRNQVMSSLMSEKEIDLNKTCYEQEGEQQGPYVSNTLECVLNKCSQITGKPVQQVKAMERGHRRNYHDDITIAVINLEFQL